MTSCDLAIAPPIAARLHREPKTSRLASAFNFGPGPSARQPVKRLVEEVLKIWPGEWVDASAPHSVHEATLLSLSIEKAGALLSWYPVWDFAEAIQRTISWYHQRHVVKTPTLREFSLTQIRDYAGAARKRNLAWASGS